MKRSVDGKRPIRSISSPYGVPLYFLAMLLLLGLPGCAIKIEGLKNEEVLKRIQEHVVMVNGMGNLIDPLANIGDRDAGLHVPFIPYSKLQYQEEYFKRLLASVGENAPRGSGGKRRILLFVHGGLNTAHSSIERAAKYSDVILKDATYPSYPIFINWDSSLTSSYLDHLLSLRQGRVAEDWCCGAWKELGRGGHIEAKVAGFIARVVTTPVYLTMDVLRGAIRLPVDIYGVYAEMISTHWRRTRTKEAEEPYSWSNPDCNKDSETGITPRADRLLCEFHHKNKYLNAYPIAQGTDQKSDTEVYAQMSRAILTVPIHIASGLVIDAAGTGSWSAMLRRTTAMFNRDDDLWSQEPHQKQTGGIAVFMTAFREWLKKKENGGKENWEVVLIGHSMGTIVVNEMVRQFGEPLEPGHHHKPLFDKIVYMAAACSLRDYLNTIPHYLEEYEGPTMYHLMLQDHAEAAEQALWGTSLPGSLLVWIDGFFARPDATLDLVAGRYQNLLRVLHLHDTPRVRPRVSLKIFGVGEEPEKTSPQTHGDFDDFPFWRETFWQIGENPFTEERLESEQTH